MLLPDTGYGYSVGLKVRTDKKTYDFKGACFGHSINNIGIGKGEQVLDIKFHMCSNSSSSKTTPKSMVMRTQDAKLWLNAGATMFGWDFDISELDKQETPQDIVINIPVNTPLTDAYFQVCWLRFPYEMNNNFLKFGALMEKVPNLFKSPFHTRFWLAYVQARPYSSGHDIIPTDAFGYGNGAPYTTTIDARFILAMTRFSRRDRNKYFESMADSVYGGHHGAHASMPIGEAISKNLGFGVSLWHSIGKAIPKDMPSKLLVPVTDTMKPEVIKIVRKLEKETKELLANPETLRKAGFTIG